MTGGMSGGVGRGDAREWLAEEVEEMGWRRLVETKIKTVKGEKAFQRFSAEVSDMAGANASEAL